MEKNNEIKVFKEMTSGQRLEIVVLKYFGTQRKLAEIVGIHSNSISRYLSGRDVTKKAALDMQKHAKINANFILYGDLPMMNEEKEEIYEGKIPIKATAALGLSETRDTATVNRGRVQLSVMHKTGRRSVISAQGDINIIDFIVDGIKKPLAINITDADFCKKYNLPFNSTLILDPYNDEELLDGTVILISENREHTIAEYINKKLYDIKNNEKLLISDLKLIKVYGIIFSVMYKF